MMNKVKVENLITNKLVTGVAGVELSRPLGINKTFQMIGNTSAGVGAAEIEVQASNDGTNFVVLDTLTLTLGTTVTSDFYANNDAWKFIRGSVKSISGTDASVSLLMGCHF